MRCVDVFGVAQAGALAILLVLTGVTPSHAGLKNPDLLLPGFRVGDIAEVSRELGYQAEARSWADGATYVLVTTAQGQFTATPVICDDERCAGLDIIAQFGSDARVGAEALNFYNRRSFIKAFSLDGTVYLARYEIADFGVPRGNLASSLANFDAIAADFERFIAEGAADVSALSPVLIDPQEAFSLEGRTTRALSPERLRARGPVPRYHTPVR